MTRPLARRARRRLRRVRALQTAEHAARLLVKLGLLDREFYEAQSGRTFADDRAAARHLFTVGAGEGLTFHPLVEPDFASSGWAKYWAQQKYTAALAGIADPRSCGEPSPVFRAATWLELHPDAAEHPGGPLGHFVATVREDTILPVGPARLGAPITWGQFRAGAVAQARLYREQHDQAGLDADGVGGASLVDWSALSAALPSRVPGRVSVLIPTYQDHAMTRGAIAAVLAERDADDVEIIVIDNGSRRTVSAVLRAAYATEPRVVLHRLGRNHNFAGGSNYAFAQSTGTHVVFLNNDTVVRPGWLAPLLAPLADPDVLGTQPLLLFGDDTVQSAGTVFLVDRHVASAYLTGHPPEDARRDPGTGFRAVTAAALAMRAGDVVDLRGFDPLFANGMEDVDLCLRAQRARPSGRFRVVADSVVTHLESKSPGRGAHIPQNRRLFIERWADSLTYGAEGRARYAALGFTVDAVLGDGLDHPAPRPVLGRPGAAFFAATVTELPQSLRWTINIAAPPYPKGELWGDTHFANALSAGLRKLGQQVAVVRHGAHDFPFAHLADVTLTIRGLDRVAPQPGAINMLWVISHPELVDRDEAARYDVTAASSAAWAARMSARTGRPIHVVHQATDPARFAPDPDAEEEVGALFVGGRPPGRARPIVDAAVATGLDLAVYGAGWRDDLPPGVLRGAHLPNDQLGPAYARAGVVLNDHWPDMAAEGFLNNRLFDAVATGARVISDHVEGIDELFRGAVRTFSTADDLAALTGPGRDAQFPDLATRLGLAAYVRAEHSFDRRAEQLLDLARDAWRARLDGTG